MPLPRDILRSDVSGGGHVRSHDGAIERCATVPSDVQLGGQSRAVGILLLQRDLTLLYANAAAVRILSFPAASEDPATFPRIVRRRIRPLLSAGSIERHNDDAPLTITSGRREYLCRTLLLDGIARPPILAVLLERPVRASDVSEVSRRFRLSRRERETIQYIALGLTTKEMAQRMSVSPNTIKQFVRFTMTKMGVSTRSGIVGKLLAG